MMVNGFFTIIKSARSVRYNKQILEIVTYEILQV